MAAVIDLRTGDHLVEAAPRPQLRLLRGSSAPLAIAPTTVTMAHPVSARSHHMRPTHLMRRTYLMRRVAVAVVGVLVVLLAANLVAGIGRAVLGSFEGAPAASGAVHVVEQGDTAWELAARYAPSLDRRVAVDAILALNGQRPIRVGQVLQLPDSFD